MNISMIKQFIPPNLKHKNGKIYFLNKYEINKENHNYVDENYYYDLDEINHNVNDYRKNIFTTHLAPSTGSLTENFLKAKSLLSPVYRNNEAISKYEAISLGPLMLKQVKKDLDRII